MGKFHQGSSAGGCIRAALKHHLISFGWGVRVSGTCWCVARDTGAMLVFRVSCANDQEGPALLCD